MLSASLFYGLGCQDSKEDKIIKTITQPLGVILRVLEVTLNLNGLFVKVLVEVDLRFPLKRVLVFMKKNL